MTVQIAMLLVGDHEFDSAKTLAAFALGFVLFIFTLALNYVALRTGAESTRNSMTELTRKSDPRLIARRYAAERRFRLYGIAALVLTTAFLLVLISDIVWRSLPAFTQYHAVLEVTVDPEKIDASNPAAGDFEGMVKTAWRDQFPSVTSRADRRLLNGLVSGAGGNELRRLVLADPSLIGKAVTVPVMLSDDADLFLKGQVTSVSRVPGQGPLRIRAEGENYFLSGQGVGPGSIVLADGGAFKIAAEGDSAPAEVIAAPGGASEVAQGQWQVLNFGVPESDRKITDRAAVWLEMVREKGSLERQIAWNFFLNGDSREAELSGILGSVLSALSWWSSSRLPCRCRWVSRRRCSLRSLRPKNRLH
jgi:phosphate transport system permease protein